MSSLAEVIEVDVAATSTVCTEYSALPDAPPARPRPVALHLLDTTMFWNPAGGVRRYVVAKQRWLAAHADWRCSVATPTPDFAATLRVPSLPLPGSGGAYRLPWRRSASARVLRGARPDLLEAADPYLLAWATLDAARALRVPAVAFCHSNLEQLARMTAGRYARAAAMRAARRYTVRLYRHFDLVLAPSRAMLAHLQAWGVEHAVHQPLGVDTAAFCPERRDMSWRASLGLPDDARLLVYAGRFAPEKHLATLVEATRRLGAPHWLLAIGAGPAPPRGERVRVLAPVRDPAALARALASSDLFVHAGDQETFGLSALEAMACGLPVVARDAEGLAELVDASFGRKVASNEPEDFADAIADLTSRDSAPLRESARARAIANDWQRVLPGLSQSYCGLVASAAAGRR